MAYCACWIQCISCVRQGGQYSHHYENYVLYIQLRTVYLDGLMMVGVRPWHDQQSVGASQRAIYGEMWLCSGWVLQYIVCALGCIILFKCLLYRSVVSVTRCMSCWWHRNECARKIYSKIMQPTSGRPEPYQTMTTCVTSTGQEWIVFFSKL